MDTSDDAAPWSGVAESGAAESWILDAAPWSGAAEPWSRDSESEPCELESLSLTEYTPHLCSEGSRQSRSQERCKALAFRQRHCWNLSLSVVPVASLVSPWPLVLASSTMPSSLLSFRPW